MSEHLQSSKQALRQVIRLRLQSLTDAQRADYSANARALLSAQPAWHAAESILFFAPFAGEVDIWPLMDEAIIANKSVALPHFAKLLDRYVACEIHELDR